MFCAAVTTINKCKTEGVIDVFQVLKSQRIQKPGSVQTIVSDRLQIIAFIMLLFYSPKQQYQEIFQIVLAYLDSFQTYSNFTS